ncbi:hypothetical protein HY500_00390 [Candidatus Woesearchaeota archaeon]|nr:hypothetical protein [Candidatus Woesearchaeota archaeon]
MSIDAYNHTLLIFFLFNTAMFSGFGQLESIRVRNSLITNSTTLVYDLYVRDSNGGFMIMDFGGNSVSGRILDYLREGRL